MKPNDFITIGVIIAPHGVRGDLRIMPQTDFPERFMHMDACYIDGKEYHVASARFHKQFVLASFKEIPDRNAAELFAKKEIQVRREDLVELPEGRYYIFDIIGLEDEINSIGDVIICVDIAHDQAKEYEHSFDREIGFLAVHGFLHLLGYDHMTEEDEKEMFGKQDEILEKFGLRR